MVKISKKKEINKAVRKILKNKYYHDVKGYSPEEKLKVYKDLRKKVKVSKEVERIEKGDKPKIKFNKINLSNLMNQRIKVKIQKAPLGYKPQIKAGKIPVKKDIQKGMLARTKEDYDLLKQPSLFNGGGD